MAQTLCPACGFTPIAAGAEQCPRCGEVFAFLQTHKRAQKAFIDRAREGDPPESTTFGGAVASAVTAHPFAPSVAFLCGAAIWFLRAAGILVDLNEPVWVFAIAVADLLVPVLIIVNLGPAQLLAQLAAVGQLAVAVWLGRSDFANPVHLLFAGHAVVLAVLVTGEPGVLRRSLGLSMAVACAAGAAAVLGLLGMRVSASELGSPAQGFHLQLPPGYVAFTRDEMAAAMHVPGGTAVPFGNSVERVFGLVTLDRDHDVSLISGCTGLHHALGGTNAVQPLDHAPPSSLGTEALVYELTTGPGSQGRLACGKLKDGRFVGFALVYLAPDSALGDGAVERVFDALGAGLSLP
jgi:hypothetical protein